MHATTISRFREKCDDYFEQAIQYREPVTVTTKDGNAIVLSEEYYRGLLATLELTRDPRFLAELKEAMAEPLEDCINENEVEW
jgi:PHD/YefM family antitoxin component YafN of YafNO toxin-antitoxin module